MKLSELIQFVNTWVKTRVNNPTNHDYFNFIIYISIIYLLSIIFYKYFQKIDVVSN